MTWQPIKTAPRDGTNILLAWGQDGVSQGCYVPGWVKPWRFLDTQDGITWLVNHAVDNEYGPTHWQPLPAGQWLSTYGVRVLVDREGASVSPSTTGGGE
jgi:hypothetical protein